MAWHLTLFVLTALRDHDLGGLDDALDLVRNESVCEKRERVEHGGGRSVTVPFY